MYIKDTTETETQISQKCKENNTGISTLFLCFHIIINQITSKVTQLPIQNVIFSIELARKIQK